MSDSGRPAAAAAGGGGTGDQLRRRLQDAGLSWPADIEHALALPSTNDRLKQRARAGAAPWTIVLADAQTAGRGRQGRRWVSPPGETGITPRPRGSTAQAPM